MRACEGEDAAACARREPQPETAEWLLSNGCVDDLHGLDTPRRAEAASNVLEDPRVGLDEQPEGRNEGAPVVRVARREQKLRRRREQIAKVAEPSKVGVLDQE